MREQFPQLAAAHRLHGDALTTFERWPEALAAYDEALRLAPGDAAATAGRTRALQRR